MQNNNIGNSQVCHRISLAPECMRCIHCINTKAIDTVVEVQRKLKQSVCSTIEFGEEKAPLHILFFSALFLFSYLGGGEPDTTIVPRSTRLDTPEHTAASSIVSKGIWNTLGICMNRDANNADRVSIVWKS